MIKMKTNIFSQELNKIKSFCTHANDGFIVIEVNDLISKSTIINELSYQFELFYLEKLNVNKELDQNILNRIFVVDTFRNDVENIDFRRWAININYNRDLLSGLGCVIFICTTKLVNELISFSSSFWSFVSLHINLNKKLDCIYSPIYIEAKNQYHFHNSYKEYDKTDMQAKRVLTAKSLSTLKKLIVGLWDEYEEWFTYYKRVKRFGDYFFENQQYIYAEVCYSAIISKIQFGTDNVRLKIDIINSLASVHFQLRNYFVSLSYLNEIKKISERNAECFSNYELAALWNNIGVLLLKNDTSKIREALSCFDEGLNIINYEETNIVISEILYNACLINYILGDYNQSRYYIDLSMKFLKQNSRFHNIIQSRFSVIKAFIMVNEGDFSNVIEMMTESLSCLRNELNENHIYILEAHYTFALIYLHLNMADRAEKCITKALKTARLSKLDYNSTACVWTLYGIVQYYVGNYNEAKNYLSLVCVNSNKIDAGISFYAKAILETMNG